MTAVWQLQPLGMVPSGMIYISSQRADREWSSVYNEVLPDVPDSLIFISASENVTYCRFLNRDSFSFYLQQQIPIFFLHSPAVIMKKWHLFDFAWRTTSRNSWLLPAWFHFFFCPTRQMCFQPPFFLVHFVIQIRTNYVQNILKFIPCLPSTFAVCGPSIDEA